MVFPHKKCMKKYLSKILKNNNQTLKCIIPLIQFSVTFFLSDSNSYLKYDYNFYFLAMSFSVCQNSL